ncbi:hypothetical protein JHD48_04535 [Sulfurimonas sp. SAG-AH-194-I05]|nr:hypothetical protein [Sulfurimonas sp. SAG-AH-194-I05]MDF1874997.1 hypothetical protein [Sulfurimonas sp. SAG-AH-194-I05]
MLNKIYNILYNKILVNIVIGNSKSTVYIEVLNSKGVIDSNEVIFDTAYYSNEMHKYILSYTKESPLFYISVLDNSINQGAIPTCSKHLIGKYQDIHENEFKCFSDAWSFYTLKSDIYELEKVYKKIGIDFIFSPFVVLANFFGDKIDSHLAIFLLVEENSMSLSVFNSGEFLFGQHIEVTNDFDSELVIEDDLEEEFELEEESIDLDDIDAIDDIDELDDFGDIADLESMDDIDEFSESKDIEEELNVNEENEDFPIQDSDGINEDYQRFSLIQSAINTFYSDEKFEGVFLENVYIADATGVSGDLKRYLEEEMFLNVYVRHMDLPLALCEIAKMELS